MSGPVNRPECGLLVGRLLTEKNCPAVAIAIGMVLASCACVDDRVGTEDLQRTASAAVITRITNKQEALQAFLARKGNSVAASSGPLEPLTQYAARCDIAAGIHVPAFSCENGVLVPGQGTLPEGTMPKPTCDYPNVLNDVCDPGSKFQVLVQNADAAAVAHCRKNTQPIAGTMYNDIAVIQYNKKNGAVCFYQALTNLDGSNVPSPSLSPPGGFWRDPQETFGIGCTACHDNGGFIRSKYLAQLTSPPHALPSTAARFTNGDPTKLQYVGLDFAASRSWAIKTGSADGGPACDGCHRLAVNNEHGFGLINGSAGNFANVATAMVQLAHPGHAPSAKNPHSGSSPIWMRPMQVIYNAGAEQSATRFRDCANGFWAGQGDGFTSGTPVVGCTFTSLGESWKGFSPAEATAIVTSTLL